MNWPNSDNTKHVIFLGAGASCTSGYPIGQELRLLMASKAHFGKKAKELYGEGSANAAQLLTYFDRFTESIELFRRGGFATVDEFSKLASSSYPEHVQNMKKLMRLVLSLHNPEVNFHESDYYPFVQRLFRSDSLNAFRNNISIVTLNYDCYLDFVMREALRHRRSLSPISREVKEDPRLLKGPQPTFEPWESKLSSGFFQPEGEKHMAWKEGQFNYFKLHGSITYGRDPIAGYDPLFIHANDARFDCLKDPYFQQYVPPIVFPWELFSTSGEFISELEFIFVKGHEGNPQKVQEGKLLFNHFKTMWENAKLMVEQADKVSFVGLSMHNYLEGGFRYLFQEMGLPKNTRIRFAMTAGTIEGPKPKEIQIVVANPENERFRNAVNRLHPASLCGKVADLLKRVAPNVKYVRSISEENGMLMGDASDKNDYAITPRYSFADFIEHEMND